MQYPKSPEKDQLQTFETRDYKYCTGFEADNFLRIVLVATRFSPGKVLDLGCGQGLMVNKFRESGIEAFGVDSRSVVSEDGEIFFRRDARDTSFPNGFFQVVTDRLLLAQLIFENRQPAVAEQVLREVQRVLSSGGILISRPPEALAQMPLKHFGVTQVQLPIPRANSMYSVLRFI